MNETEALQSFQKQIEQADPEALQRVMQEHPEWFKVVFNAQRELELIEKAKTDSPEGYKAFYELLYGFPPPEHIMLEIEEIYKAHDEGIGALIWAWRGSWKSVSLSVTFIAYRIGLEPRKTNMVVGANDDSAEKVTKAIANIIEFHPSWKKVFQHVVPDTGRWSVEGFYVMDNTVSREEWAKLQAAIIDPTLVGGGWSSSRLIGKHPSGVLDIDDIHDLKNSSSPAERVAIVNTVTKVLLKTLIKVDDKMSTWLTSVGTPWSLDDAYHEMKKTGQYRFISIPAMKRAQEGDEGAVYCDGINRNGVVFEDIVGWWVLADPKHYGIKSVIKDRADGKAAFWEQIMLDLSTAKSSGLKYYTYPNDRIDDTWPMRGGVDPAATFKDKFEDARRNSHFALAYVAKIPAGGAVVKDGVSEICNPNTAVVRIAAAESLFQNWTFTAVENVGFGIAFKKIVELLNPRLKLVSSDLGGLRQKGERSGKMRSKHDRILYELAPWFENATIRISDGDTPFLNALKRLFDNFYELDDSVADEAWDVGDSVYHAVKSMPEVLQTVILDEMDSVFVRRSRHPLTGMQRRGYG